jgi:hypothetical protein
MNGIKPPNRLRIRTMNDSPSENILYHLKRGRHLTVESLANLVFPQSGTQTIRGIAYPKALQKTQARLQTLRKHGFVECYKLEAGKKSLWYSVDNTAPSRLTYYHDLLCGQLYSAFAEFAMEWYTEEQDKFRYDCKMVLDDLVVYFEVDRNTEPLRTRKKDKVSIERKMDAYIAHARETGQRLYVVFVIDGVGAEARLTSIVELARQKDKGMMFTATLHKHITAHPSGPVLISYMGEILSLDDLYSNL